MSALVGDNDSRFIICLIIGKSPVIPIAPNICLNSRATFKAISTLFLFAIDICAAVALFLLRKVPRRHASNCALVISVNISANFF